MSEEMNPGRGVQPENFHEPMDPGLRALLEAPITTQRGGIKYPTTAKAPIKVLVINPSGEISTRLIAPTDEAVSEIIFDGNPDGPVGEFACGDVVLLMDECAGDDAATAIPNHRATILWDAITNTAVPDPFAEPLLGTVVLAGRDTKGNYTSVREGVMNYKFKEGAPVATDRAEKRRRLEAAKALLGSLEAEIKDLEGEVGRKFPEPSGNRWSVTVQFSSSGTWYEYLLLRIPSGAWYTTGRGDDDKFADWDALVDWLEGPDVYSHSSLRRLRLNGEEYEFPLGEVVMTANGEPVF